MRQNPATHDVWSFSTWHSIKARSRRPRGTPSGLLLFGSSKGRGGAWKSSAMTSRSKLPTARELQKALSTLHNYDELTLALHALHGWKPPPKLTGKKKTTPRTRKNS
jgi:hypothetical protein